MYVCFDQIVDQAQKLRYMMGGQGRIPVTYIVPGSGARAGLAGQHSDHLYPMLLQAGLKVVIPSCPLDAKGLFTAAMREDDPVVLFAPAAAMNTRGLVPEEEVYIPLGKGEVKVPGNDVTVVAIGPLVPEAVKVATRLQGDGISMEVIDPRSLLPFDHALVAASVRRTGRLVVFDDANRTCGMAEEFPLMPPSTCSNIFERPSYALHALMFPCRLARPSTSLCCPGRSNWKPRFAQSLLQLTPSSSMPMLETPIRVPKLGMDTTEALLVKWLAKEGDTIQNGTPLIELETEKVTFEYQSEITGRLIRILIPEGQTVPVGEIVAIAETN